MMKRQYLAIMCSGVALAAIPFTSFALMAREPIACTMDAKMCPDGTYVGRSGPNCEFKCPAEEVKPAPTPTPSNEFKRGATSDKIKDLQTILQSEPSIYTGPATGYFGPMTEAAIKKLQLKYGLTGTGVVDTTTREMLFPTNVTTQITVLSPNGGEVWKTGESQTISWKTVFGANQVPMPDPMPVMPTNNPSGMERMMNPNTVTSSSGNTGSGVANSGTVTVSRKSTFPVRMFFPRASIMLLKDSDPTFMKPLGTANLYESSRIVRIPAGFPEGKDYRVRIGIGGQTPCLYRAETAASAMGKTIDASMVSPCPMEIQPLLKSTDGADNPMWVNSSLSASDTSDGTFAIMAGTITSNDQNIEVKRKIAELEAMIKKMTEEIAHLRALIGTTPQ